LKKLWVAGATGFLGTHLVRVLKAQGHELVLASRSGGEVEGLPVQAVDPSSSSALGMMPADSSSGRTLEKRRE